MTVAEVTVEKVQIEEVDGETPAKPVDVKEAVNDVYTEDLEHLSPVPASALQEFLN